MAKQVTSGKCVLCDLTFSKAAMTKHLKSCLQTKGALEGQKDTQRRQQNQRLLHLVIEGRYQPEYWMHVEVPAKAALYELDEFLRGIWLECCGHLSAFNIQGKSYGSDLSDEMDDESMDSKLGEVLAPGMKFYHEYDFGTTTALALKLISEREAKPTGAPVRLLARNDPPSISCASCGKTATQVCTECLCTGEGGWLCDECVEAHACEDELLLPVVNSPRVGMCGYTG